MSEEETEQKAIMKHNVEAAFTCVAILFLLWGWHRGDPFLTFMFAAMGGYLLAGHVHRYGAFRVFMGIFAGAIISAWLGALHFTLEALLGALGLSL